MQLDLALADAFISTLVFVVAYVVYSKLQCEIRIPLSMYVLDETGELRNVFLELPLEEQGKMLSKLRKETWSWRGERLHV